MSQQENIKDSTLCEWHTKDITELQNTIYGNGSEGLKTGVVKLREHVRLLLWINAIMAGATIGLLLKSIWALIVKI